MQIDVLEVDGVYYGMFFSGLFVESYNFITMLPGHAAHS